MVTTTNSMKMHIEADDSISDVKLLIPQHKQNVVIFVEGISDVEFLSKIFRKNKNVFIQETIGSKEKIKTIIKNNYLNDNKIIGIIDKDYNEYEKYKNIFYYDYCCLEAMLIASNETYENCIPIIYNGKEDIWNLRENILHKLKPLSLARKFNCKNNLKINFDGIKIPNMISKNHHINIKLLIEELIKKNNKLNFSLHIKTQMENCIKKQIYNEFSLESLLYITQGHDLLSMIKIHCDLNKNKHINDKELMTALKSAYRLSDFKKTNLYKNLVEYFSPQNIQLF